MNLQRNPSERMRFPKPNIHWKAFAIASLILLVAAAASAVITRHWVLMAVPLGFLFGLFLQKGDLCGASACSEVLLFRSLEKWSGLWVCIVTSMAGFAILDILGWVELNPKLD